MRRPAALPLALAGLALAGVRPLGAQAPAAAPADANPALAKVTDDLRAVLADAGRAGFGLLVGWAAGMAHGGLVLALRPASSGRATDDSSRA